MKTFFLIAYVLITLRCIISILLHGNRPTKSLSWLFAVIIFPYIGALLYYMFGINRRKFEYFKSRQSEKKEVFDEEFKSLNDLENRAKLSALKEEKLARLIYKSTLLAPYYGNKVTLLNDGETTFKSIFEAIEKAERFIHLQYYIFKEGELTQRFYDIFKEKIDQGVEIRLIYDSLGSFSFRGKTIKRFKKIGVKAYPMLPVRFGNLLFTLNYRNHRKIIVIDGKIGFTGGVNVTDKYIKPISNLGVWQDVHLKLEGPVVASLHRVFIKDYYFASDDENLFKKKYIPKVNEEGTHVVQIVAAGPDAEQPAILQQYVSMINCAEKRVCIANPYFIPTPSIIEALKIAIQSGVEVALLIPEKSDSKMAKYSMMSRMEQLLAVGVKVYLRPDFSHSKMVLIDGEIASVGSGNFDYRSFEHNFETNALLYNKGLTKALQKEFEKVCEDCTCLSYETFKKRPIKNKLLEGMAKLFSPLL